nr:DNA polymerase [uncultured Mediterranean phage uvMED]BAR22820.1 DNA polymerase [uncultured Mediterranean phage uvMED]BAR22840.1 DNA polymerase [uncultured Mediterranean phage uvMED]
MSPQVFQGIEHLGKLATSQSLCFDTETLQLQPERGKLRLLQLGARDRDTIVLIDCFQLDKGDWADLRWFFSTPTRFWLAHNAVFDLGWLQEHNIYPAGWVRCSMLASRLLTNGLPNSKHGLDSVVKRYLKDENGKPKELSKEQQRSDWSGDLSQEQLEYAANDVAALMELDPILEHRISRDRLGPAFKLECRALPAMAQMWRTGLPWNAENLQQRKIDYEHDIKGLAKDFVLHLDAAMPEEHKLPRDEDGSFNLRPKDQGKLRDGTKKYAGFNINSPKQLVEKLTVVLGAAPRDANGKPSASRQALRSYAADHEVIQIYLEWKRCEKRRQMIESIQEKMDGTGFVRASYMQLGAESGRMSCIKPNNQQIPRDKQFRSCVEAPEGWLLVDADFGQMELRLAAAVADDERMIAAFQAGEDPHTVTAEAIGCDRQTAKSANFGLLYGSGATGLRNYAGGMGITMTQERAADIRNEWLGVFQGVAKWQRDNAKEADETQDDKWAATRVPISGMRRYLQGDMNRLTVRCNTPIQGAGAAILKCALGNLWPKVKEAGEDTVRIAAAVHDEILLLVRENAAQEWAATLKQVMEDAEAKWLGEIPALAEVSVGKTWSETH